MWWTNDVHNALLVCMEVNELLTWKEFVLCKSASNSIDMLQQMQGAEGIIDMSNEAVAKVKMDHCYVRIDNSTDRNGWPIQKSIGLCQIFANQSY